MFGFKESSLSSLNSNGVKKVEVPSITAVKESKFKVMWLSSYFVVRCILRQSVATGAFASGHLALRVAGS